MECCGRVQTKSDFPPTFSHSESRQQWSKRRKTSRLTLDTPENTLCNYTMDLQPPLPSAAVPRRLCDACNVARPVLRRPKNNAQLCKACFFEIFEAEVHSTIIENALFTPGQRVAIAASGGKGIKMLAMRAVCIVESQTPLRRFHRACTRNERAQCAAQLRP